MKTKRTYSVFEQFEARNMMSATPHVSGEPEPKIVPATTVPARASALTAAVSATGVTLKWTDNSNNEAGFSIFVINPTTHGLLQVGHVDANVTTFTDPKPAFGSDTYMVRAVNADGRGEVSNAVTVKISAPVVVTAPTKMQSSAVSPTSIKLSWDGARNATGGYQILRSADGASGWNQVGSTNALTKTFIDTQLSAGTRYYYRIVAVGDGSTATSVTIIGQTKVNKDGDNHTVTHK